MMDGSEVRKGDGFDEKGPMTGTSGDRSLSGRVSIGDIATLVYAFPHAES